MDEGEDMVIPDKSNGNDKEVTEKEKEGSNTKSSKEVIKDIMHRPEKLFIDNIPNQYPPPTKHHQTNNIPQSPTTSC